MLNLIVAMVLSAAPAANKLPENPFSDQFMDCANNGGQIYALSDGSLVCEEHR